MKVGFSKVCITPPYGSPIAGYYEPRRVKGVLDNLYARAVALDDGVEKSVIIALDLINLNQKIYDAIKLSINEATGVKKEALFINCSHTHTGPRVGFDGATGEESSETYNNFLVDLIRDAAIYALADLKESKVETASADAKGISFIRRYRMKNGTVATNPGVNNPNIDHALGTPYEKVKLVKIIREDADDIFLVNFGTHPDTIGGEYISADYIGYLCNIVESAVLNTKCVFLLGCQGDVNHVNVNPTKGQSAITKIDFDGVPRGIKHAEHMGRVLAGAVISVCSLTEEVKADKISFATKTVELPSYQQNERLIEARKIHELYISGKAHELPYKEMELTTVVAEAERIIELENGPMSYPYTLSAIKIGDLVFAGIGGEAFTEIGNRIRENSPYENTVVCCITNCAGGYVPTKSAYDEGGYEARSSRLKPGGDDIIIEGMINLLEELK